MLGEQEENWEVTWAMGSLVVRSIQLADDFVGKDKTGIRIRGRRNTNRSDSLDGFPEIQKEILP